MDEPVDRIIAEQRTVARHDGFLRHSEPRPTRCPPPAAG
jgi:hypothetical protein